MSAATRRRGGRGARRVRVATAREGLRDRPRRRRRRVQPIAGERGRVGIHLLGSQKKVIFLFRVLFCPSTFYSDSASARMDGAAAYLEHATRASSSEDDVEHEVRFGSAFAALAVDDDASDHDTSDARLANRDALARLRRRRRRGRTTRERRGSPGRDRGRNRRRSLRARRGRRARVGVEHGARGRLRARRDATCGRGSAPEEASAREGREAIAEEAARAETRAARSASGRFTPADVKAALERLSGRLNTHTVPNADLAPEDACRVFVTRL